MSSGKSLINNTQSNILLEDLFGNISVDSENDARTSNLSNSNMPFCHDRQNGLLCSSLEPNNGSRSDSNSTNA